MALFQASSSSSSKVRVKARLLRQQQPLQRRPQAVNPLLRRRQAAEVVVAVVAVSNLRRQPVLQLPLANNQRSRQPLLLRHKAGVRDSNNSSNSRAMVTMLRVVAAVHHGALSRH